MSIDKELEKSRQTIVDLLEKAENDLADALLRADFERVASESYMVTEYEQMIEEFDQHYVVSNN